MSELEILQIFSEAELGQERRKDIGQRFVMWIIENANIGRNQLLGIHTQYHAKRFYEGLGFVQIGDSFKEVGIRHVYMEFFLQQNNHLQVPQKFDEVGVKCR